MSERRDQRNWQIRRFSKHRDGYLHANLVIDGKPIYVHCKHGSWMRDGERAGTFRELPQSYAFALAEKGRAWRKAEKDKKEAERMDAILTQTRLLLHLEYPTTKIVKTLTGKFQLTKAEATDTINRVKTTQEVVTNG